MALTTKQIAELLQLQTISTKETAELLGVSTRTLQRWRQTEGMGPDYVRNGPNQVRYRPLVVKRWLDEHTEN